MKAKWLVAIFVLGGFFFALRPSRIDLSASGNNPLATRYANSTKKTAEQASPVNFKEWVAAGMIDMRRGKELAFARKEVLRGLMRMNPSEAISESLSWSEWAALPAELQGLVERPFSQQVDFEVLPDCPPGRRHGQLARRVYIEGAWRTTYVFGPRENLKTKEGLPARGFILDGEVALAETGVERLTGENLAAARSIFGQAGTADRAVLLGGEILEVNSDAEEAELREALSAAEISLHPKSVVMAAGSIASFDLESTKKISLLANSTWTETPRRTLGVRISYADAPASFSYTAAEMTNLFNNCSNHVKVMSYGKSSIVPRIASVTLDNVFSFYEDSGPDTISAEVTTALAALGINTSDYDFITLCHPGHGSFGYAGLGQVGGSTSWLNGNVSVEVAVHEMGHNFGLLHAHYWLNATGGGSSGRSLPGTGGAIEHEEYGDPFDVMGGSTLPQGQYGSHGKAALNWIEPKEVINVVTNGIYRISRFDHKDARTNAAAKLALKIQTAAGEEYWVSHRRLFAVAGNAFLTKAAQIHRADGEIDQSLMDTTPLSQRGVTALDRDDSALAIGKAFSDPMGTVAIKTIASAGTAPQEYLDVQVTFMDGAGAYDLYTTVSLATNGLVGSYVNRSLRDRPDMDDWRTAPDVGTSRKRVDKRLVFTSNGWGARGPVGITSGTDADWDDYSVQWDGFLVVRRPVRLVTISDDSSRFWVDLNKDNSFDDFGPELVNNHWGIGQGATRGDVSEVIAPGTYAIRVQYEEGFGGNTFVLTGSELLFEFYTDDTATTPGLIGSYVGNDLRTVFQNDWRTTQTIAGTRVDAYPGFSVDGWGSLDSVGLSAGFNGNDGNWEQFSVQWDGYLSNSVPIKAATISDDHSRMWIDLNTNGVFSTMAPEIIINGWGGTGQGMTLGTVSQTIPPGFYKIRIQYEEGFGGNGMIFVGAPQFPVDAVTLFSSLVFAGADNRTTARNVGTNFTVQFWMKSLQVAGAETRWTDGMGLVDGTAASGGSFGVSLGNGRALFGVNGGVDRTIQSQYIADDQWHYISARRDAATGEIALFIDGIASGRGTGGNDPLIGASVLTLGSLSDGSNHYIGSMDTVKIWNVARTDAQILADYHISRAGHGVADPPPTVQLVRLQPNFYQIYWDAISSYRKLEAAANVTGPWISLPTDQNSTNVPVGANIIRFFRVAK